MGKKLLEICNNEMKIESGNCNSSFERVMCSSEWCSTCLILRFYVVVF